MAKQVVFIVNTDKDGAAEALGQCKAAGALSGRVKEIVYIPDNRVPFDAAVSFSFSAADSGEEVLEVEGVDGRQTWNIEGGPELKDEAIRVVVTNGGKGRSGSFRVTCA